MNEKDIIKLIDGRRVDSYYTVFDNKIFIPIGEYYRTFYAISDAKKVLGEKKDNNFALYKIGEGKTKIGFTKDGQIFNSLYEEDILGDLKKEEIQPVELDKDIILKNLKTFYGIGKGFVSSGGIIIRGNTYITYNSSRYFQAKSDKKHNLGDKKVILIGELFIKYLNKLVKVIGKSNIEKIEILKPTVLTIGEYNVLRIYLKGGLVIDIVDVSIYFKSSRSYEERYKDREDSIIELLEAFKELKGNFTNKNRIQTDLSEYTIKTLNLFGFKPEDCDVYSLNNKQYVYGRKGNKEFLVVNGLV